MPTPSTLRSAAARLDAEAGALPAGLRSVATAAGPHVWRGPAADRFEQHLAEHVRGLGRAAASLHAEAARLRARADGIEQTAAAATAPGMVATAAPAAASAPSAHLP